MADIYLYPGWDENVEILDYQDIQFFNYFNNSPPLLFTDLNSIINMYNYQNKQILINQTKDHVDVNGITTLVPGQYIKQVKNNTNSQIEATKFATTIPPGGPHWPNIIVKPPPDPLSSPKPPPDPLSSPKQLPSNIRKNLLNEPPPAPPLSLMRTPRLSPPPPLQAQHKLVPKINSKSGRAPKLGAYGPAVTHQPLLHTPPSPHTLFPGF